MEQTLERARRWWNDFSLMVSIFLVMLVLFELSARVYYGVRPKSSSWFDSRMRALSSESGLAAKYESEDLVDYLKDYASCPTKLSWRPYVYFRRKECKTNHVNVENGFRRTSNSTPWETAKTKIFMFGGSTTWGTGASDSKTIPSFVHDELKAKGFANFHVKNFGEHAYVSTQELTQLMLELRAGNVPDVVTFYDGANDTVAAIVNGVAGVTQAESNFEAAFVQMGTRPPYLPLFREDSKALTFLFNVANKLSPNRELASKRFPEATESTFREVARLYAGNMKLVNSLAKTYGFKAFFFRQPTAFSKRTLTEAEKTALVFDDEYFGKLPDGNGRLATSHERVYRFIDEDSTKPSNYSDLSKIFDDSEHTLFYDYVHVTDRGNAVVGKKIAATIASSVPRR